MSTSVIDHCHFKARHKCCMCGRENAWRGNASGAGEGSIWLANSAERPAPNA